MDIRSARFILENNWENQQSIQEQIDDSSVIFQGNGCGYSIEKRLNPDRVQIRIWTVPIVMDTVIADPRLELIEKLEGWPEPEPEDEDELS